MFSRCVPKIEGFRIWPDTDGDVADVPRDIAVISYGTSPQPTVSGTRAIEDVGPKAVSWCGCSFH